MVAYFCREIHVVRQLTRYPENIVMQIYSFMKKDISIIESITKTQIIQAALVFNAAIYQPESFLDNFRYYLDISNISKTCTCILINESFMEILFNTIHVINENNFRDIKMVLESTQLCWKAQNSYCDSYYKHFVAVSSMIAKFCANFLFKKNIYVKKHKHFLKNLQNIRNDYIDISRQTYATIKIFMRTYIASTALIFLKSRKSPGRYQNICWMQ